MTVIITIPVHGQAEVRSPYEAREIIKDTVDPWARSWSKSRRLWLINPAYAEPLAAMLRAHGYPVHLEDNRGPSAPPPPPRAPQRSWVEQCFDACPQALREKLRRVLMSVFHPDAGGDTATAKEINSVADYHERNRR